MADYLTTDTELTSVANAIRTKGGTSAQLVYPTGFVSAIDAISTTPTLQSKTAYPRVSAQIVNPDSGYDGLSQVTIDAIPQPICNLSAVSNHSVTVTPKITDHYSAQGSGSSVTISASDLVSGTLTITENGTVDVTNYASALVSVDSGGGVETAHIYADLSMGGNAYYTDANGNLGTETVDYNTGMVVVDDFAPVGSLVVFYAIPMPMAAPTGMSLVGQVSTQKMNLAYVYQVVGS